MGQLVGKQDLSRDTFGGLKARRGSLELQQRPLEVL